MDRRRFLKSALFTGTALTAAHLVPNVARAAMGNATPTGFQRLFPTLSPAVFSTEDLLRLAEGDGKDLSGMTAQPEVLENADGTARRNKEGHLLITATAEDEQDDEENFGIPSGYTYLGQFIDHDLTLNPNNAFGADVNTPRDPNLRTAWFDLDSLYGRGPADQPYLFAADGRTLLTGRKLTEAGAPSNCTDLPRVNGRAVIGDKRNDENVIVSQLHSAFVAFHNQVARERTHLAFPDLAREVAWHYQWIVLTDFLPRIVGPKMMQMLLPDFGTQDLAGSGRANRSFTQGLRPGEMPLEFAGAAYRFGHSMIRPAYRINSRLKPSAQEKKENPALAGRRLIFAASQTAGLNGFREYPQEWAIDWSLYFETTERKLTFDRIKDGPTRVQAAYKFDTALVNPLAFLPEFSQSRPDGHFARDGNGQPLAQPGKISSLALRNLLRGVQQGLPSGQAVARAMGLDPLSDKDLRIGKATCEDMDENRAITAYGDSFNGNTPL
ncbi:peroxidase family protein, partial [Elstera litoralis]|uniref:peroxidase family protein n=1 Tax=Elstera litoralis TaxID=552518 RepID=UPI0006989C38